MDGVSSGLYRLVLVQTGRGVESEQRERAHSASCAVAMV
jgi:hypothetical protein